MTENENPLNDLNMNEKERHYHRRSKDISCDQSFSFEHAISERDLTNAEILDSDIEELTALPTISTKVYFLLYAGIALLIFILGIGCYRTFPFYNKIEGTWLNSDDGSYEIVNKGKTSIFKFKNLQGSEYADLVLQGDLKRKAANRYEVNDVFVYLEINKAGFSEAELRALKADTEHYKIGSETGETLRLNYTETAIKLSFPDQDLDQLFYYTLENFKYGIFGQDLRLRNTAFAENSILFTR